MEFLILQMRNLNVLLLQIKEPMDKSVQRALTDHLGSFVSEQRRARIDAVLNQRTRYLTLALEDIYQAHNASAVLRSAESFGVQDIHVVEDRNAYQVNQDVAVGASHWLNLIRYQSEESRSGLEACCKDLTARGYRLVAATPEISATPVQEFDVDAGKVAVFFGTEEQGLTVEALNLTSEKVRIPMFGFVESLNVSVCAALILSELTTAIRHSTNVSWHLTDEEKEEIQLSWYRRIVKGSATLEKRFLQEMGRS